MPKLVFIFSFGSRKSTLLVFSAAILMQIFISTYKELIHLKCKKVSVKIKKIWFQTPKFLQEIKPRSEINIDNANKTVAEDTKTFFFVIKIALQSLFYYQLRNIFFLCWPSQGLFCIHLHTWLNTAMIKFLNS